QAVTSAEGCIFCEPSLFENGSLPFIFHEDGAVTFANQYPTVIPHYVTVFTKNHAPDLNDIGEDDLKGYFSSGRDIALLLKKEGHSGMWDFINWGLGAGGTQPHPHAQRGALHKLATTHADQEWQSIKRHRIVLNKDPFQWYFDSIRDSNLFIYENDTVFIAASFAPRFPDQVDVYMKRDVCHFGELFPDEAKVLATDVSRLFRGLRNLSYAVGGKTLSKEIRNLNFITHQSRFNHDGQYRLHWHIYPRESLIGGTELSGLYASATYPENVTMSLRPYFL
ncbi:MAG TPA: hypothetical protein VJK03_05485, partial [Candidatus Nanoarchaeia archaeon]|nr:hypothetical protein [Candidatus Nanoarchaeia archaeon]